MKPYGMTWNITNRCNLACKHCTLNFNNELTDELTTEECKSVIDQLANEKVFILSFSGGEPLIREDFIDIIKYCYKKKIQTLVATNGILLTEEVLIQLKRSGTTAIAISLDSIVAEKNDAIRGKGTFDRILESMRLVKKHNMKLILSTIVDKESVNHLRQTLRFSRDIGCDRVKVQVVLAEDSNGNYRLVLEPEELLHVAEICSSFCKEIHDDEYIAFNCYSNNLKIHFEKGIKNKICNAGQKRGIIMPNGDVRACELLPETVKGNLKIKPFNELWDNIAITRDLEVAGKCSRCKYSNICNGGCPIFSKRKGELNDINCRGAF